MLKNEKLRRNIGDVPCGQIARINVVRSKEKSGKKKKWEAKLEEKMGKNFPEPKKDRNPHIQELQNLNTIKQGFYRRNPMGKSENKTRFYRWFLNRNDGIQLTTEQAL